jgi:hypothetical protein
VAVAAYIHETDEKFGVALVQSKISREMYREYERTVLGYGGEGRPHDIDGARVV